MDAGVIKAMRQKHATCDKNMRHATKTCDVRQNRAATVECCRKKVEWFQLSCDSMQQSHVAQISPFTQRDFVARRMFLSHVPCFCRMSHVFVARRMFLSHVACFCRMSHVFVASCKRTLSIVVQPSQTFFVKWTWKVEPSLSYPKKWDFQP